MQIPRDQSPNEKSFASDARWLALVEDFLAHAKSTPEHLAALFAVDPDHIMGWCAKGFFLTLMARAELRASAMNALQMMTRAIDRRGVGEPERMYQRALAAAVNGEFTRAVARLDLIADANPNDSFAVKLAHALRFMLGDARGMAQAIDRALSRGEPSHPHRGYLLGCQAFALEESGRYADAERAGREAVLRAPRDAWGVHAVAHVYEMTGQARVGAEWLTSHERNIVHCNNFGGHVFWHLALFRLELGDRAGALALYDSRVRADRTDDFRDIANAASLLARLAIDGVNVGDRWEELADIAETHINDRSLLFADLHYALALVGAGRSDKAAELAASLGVGAHRGDQRRVADLCGAAIADAIQCWGDGDHDRAANLLLATADARQRLGGSHAQRDIFEQITIDALMKSGRREEARDRLSRRLAARVRNRFAEGRLTALLRSAPVRQRGERVAVNAL